MRYLLGLGGLLVEIVLRAPIGPYITRTTLVRAPQNALSIEHGASVIDPLISAGRIV